MNTNQLYITLPSNASINKHPDNTLSNYITDLAQPIKLNYPYEVALVELTFPNNWQQNITIGKIIIKYKDKIVDTGEITIADIHNNSLSIINHKIKQINVEHFQIPTDVEIHRIQIVTPHNDGPKNFYQYQIRGPGISMIFIGEQLCDFLHVESNKIYNHGDRSQLSETNIDLKNTLYPDTLYIYTDIISHQYVGDTMSQLLATIPILTPEGQTQSTQIQNPHYLPINRDSISSIQITIKDDTNQIIKFKTGIRKVIVKLHIRPQKYGF